MAVPNHSLGVELSAKQHLVRRCLGCVPVILALVLLTAAFLKGYELATEELPENNLFTSRWFWAALVLFELGLGIWLLGGLHVRATRWLLLFTFLVFFETALYLAVAGYGTCHCLGRTVLSPWAAALFDAGAVVAIVLWQPPARGPTVFSQPRRAGLLGVVFGLAAIPALVSIINYTPTGQMPSLRSDPALAARVKVQLQDATAQQLLDHLHSATGLTFSVDDRLASTWSTSFGDIRMSGIPAWAIMEFLAHKQSRPARWDKIEGGYRLVSTARLDTRTPWLISGALLLATGAYLFFLRSRATKPLSAGASQ